MPQAITLFVRFKQGEIHSPLVQVELPATAHLGEGHKDLALRVADVLQNTRGTPVEVPPMRVLADAAKLVGTYPRLWRLIIPVRVWSVAPDDRTAVCDALAEVAAALHQFVGVGRPMTTAEAARAQWEEPL